MSVIKVENLTFSYPSSYENIFENVSFRIDTDWKLGFIGRNGRGKTTFLKLLCGEYDYGGKIISSVKFNYFPYPVRDKTMITEEVLAEVCLAAEEWRLMRELSCLEVDCDCLYRPFGTLSNGERTKVLLAALFLNEGHFLLIDEYEPSGRTRTRASLGVSQKEKELYTRIARQILFRRLRRSYPIDKPCEYRGAERQLLFVLGEFRAAAGARTQARRSLEERYKTAQGCGKTHGRLGGRRRKNEDGRLRQGVYRAQVG